MPTPVSGHALPGNEMREIVGAACYTASCSRRTAASKSRKVEALSESESIHLAADISFLHTDYLWRMPGSWIGYPYYCSSEFYEDLARIAPARRRISAAITKRSSSTAPSGRATTWRR